MDANEAIPDDGTKQHDNDQCDIPLRFNADRAEVVIIGTVSGKQPIPQVPYYEDHKTLRPSEVIPDDTNGVASIPPVQAGCITAVSNILMRAFVGAYTSRCMLLDDALLKGAGIDLTWSTLWDYTTINAKGAHAWLQDHFI